MKILVIRFSAIGDIVWTSPTLRCLKTQLPSATIHFATKAQYRMMVDQNPYIDKVHYLDQDLNTLIDQLKAEKFDFVLDLHKNLRTAWIKLRLGVKSYTYHKMNWRRWLLVYWKLKRLPNVHVADRYLAAAKPLGIRPDGKGLDYFLATEEYLDTKAALPSDFHAGFVAIVTGASTFTKKLPPAKLIELCQYLNRPVVLLGGKEDRATATIVTEYFAKHPFGRVRVFNACGLWSLNQAVSIAQKSQAVIGHDTGLTHIMAAFDVPLYAIYGGTSTLGFHPYKEAYQIVENTHLACRPCSKSGLDKCPKGHFKCMQDLVFDFKVPEYHPQKTPNDA
jgi:ADP-heptose:LPS heptosyltransferase